MPELPEVETVVRYLRAPLTGRRLQSVERLDPRLQWDGAGAAGLRVEAVERLGKQVVIALGPGRGRPATRWVGVHLRMGEAALERALPEAQRWTLPAYRRHDVEHDPAALADLLVLADHPDRPAVQRSR